MKKLKITQETALLLYKNSNETGQQLLSDQFGPEMFIPKPVTERVKTFADACTALGMDTIPVFQGSVDEVAYQKLKVIIRALNEGWVPDWTNSNEYKWLPYFKYSAGFGFSYTYYVHWYAGTYVCSRLVFKSRELAVYAAEQFKDIYNDYLTIQ